MKVDFTAMSENAATAGLSRQLGFIREINALKNVLRKSLMPDTERFENSAEHSWHVAMMADVLSEHANETVDVGRVIRMLLIHDIVEVDAGDTDLYDAQGRVEQYDREARAAGRLFGLLPEQQAAEFRALWDEFEERKTADARFAKALDRFQPLFLNFQGGGVAWIRRGIRRDQVSDASGVIADGSMSLWREAQRLITEAHERGWLV
ncbi:MAG: putative hydrolase of HD superfamily [Candidatus Promineifilaceae bacterium]|jgi:putative hydrolase of HD superfamily